MTPRISKVMIGNSLDLRITDFRTDGGYRTQEAGHGLIVTVFAVREANEYQPDPKLELRDASIMLEALSKCEPVLEFDYVDLHYLNCYGRIGPKSGLVYGTAFIVIRREKLLQLRSEKIPAAEYPKHWRFVHGFKDRLDSKESFLWSSVNAEVLE